MRRGCLIIAVSALVAGCGGEKELETPVKIEEVPPALVKVAEKELPGVKFDSAYKEKKDGKDVYELRGKTKEGKIRDIEVNADGKVIEVD